MDGLEVEMNQNQRDRLEAVLIIFEALSGSTFFFFHTDILIGKNFIFSIIRASPFCYTVYLVIHALLDL